MQKPFVISISGVSGSGKTAVKNELEKLLKNSAVICFDDYDEKDVYLSGRDINEWPTDRNGYDDWQVEIIAEDIERLLNETLDYIILDYPFGRENTVIGKYIDLAVFIDVPLDVALARRLIRDYTDRTPARHNIDVNLNVVGEYLKHYLKYQIPTYQLCIKTQKPYADIVIDGTNDVKESVDKIIVRVVQPRSILDK
ncbi:MAG: nucleoside/nucleotide kinase family protein [Saccharofermentanales bacterium]